MLNRIRNSAFTLIMLIFLPAISHAQKITLYDQLVSVNKEWQNQPDVDPALKNTAAQSLNEKELVRFHLMETEKLLRSRKPLELTASQKKNRESNLNTLHRYWQNAVFPINNLYFARQPVFIDNNNTYCAVGYLIKESGAEAVAKEIQQTQNYNYLFDIDHPKLMDWVNNSGLDFGELALVQPTYGGEWPATITEMHYNNTGADVNEYIEVHESSGGLSGMSPLNRIDFYDQQDLLYKSLAVADMQTFLSTTIFHYYLFPANESFADNGRIVLMGYAPPPYDTISVFTYDASGVTMKDYYNFGQPYTLHYNVKEDETTQAGTSLGFCGRYGNTNWDLVSQFQTVGTLNACIVMPLALTVFDYKLNNKTVELKWQTASEINTDYFDIEKSSDGNRYVPVGRVKASGNSTSIKNYNYTDVNPGYINHYRLKQVDQDGKSSYSKILFVKRPELNTITIAINLVQSKLNVQVNSDQPDAGSITIYDFSGRQVLKIKAQHGNQDINISNLGCGKYIIRLYSPGGKVYSQQFVKGS